MLITNHYLTNLSLIELLNRFIIDFLRRSKQLIFDEVVLHFIVSIARIFSYLNSLSLQVFFKIK